MPMLPEYVYWIYRKCNGPPVRAHDERRETCRLSIHTEVPNMSSRLTMVGFALVLLSIVLLLSPFDIEALGHPPEQDDVTTVYLVRHAEKDTIPEGDPQLSEAGEERAQRLRHVLEEAGVTAIYATQFRRTQDTVRPLADLLGLEVKIVAASESERLVATIQQDHQGEVVVVCGHSNTVPEIIEALGAGPVAPIEEANEYDNLYVVRLANGGGAEATTLKFGRRPQ